MIYRFRKGWFGRLTLVVFKSGTWMDAKHGHPELIGEFELHRVGNAARIALYEKRAAAARKGRAKKKEAA